MCKVGNRNQARNLGKKKGAEVIRALMKNRLSDRLCRKGSCIRNRNRLDVHTTAILVEKDSASHESEDGVVTAKTDVTAWNPLRTTLAEDDVATDDGFAAEFLDAKTLALAVATVFDGTLSFFMGHKKRVLKN
jgi:hypothetical protein